MTTKLTKLGNQVNFPCDAEGLEFFPNPGKTNPEAGNPFIYFETSEFTCLCPMTGQPDFARIRIIFEPDELCVESKSLKMWLWGFRDLRAFHEKIIGNMYSVLKTKMKPMRLSVVGEFNARGGIKETVVHGASEMFDWVPR